MEIEIPLLRQALMTTGQACVVDNHGKRIMLSLWQYPKGLLIAYEGEGAFLYEGDRPLNRFRLVDAGFSLIVAPTLVRLVNDIMLDVWTSRQEQAAAIPQRLLTAECREDRP